MSTQDLIKAQTVRLGGKDYVMVAGRLLLAHADNDKMDVITEIVSMTDQAVVVKATVTTRKGVFTGHAVSLSSGKGVEGQKPLETAETSAVGRALGYAGYAIEGGVASADEVQAAHAEQQDREPPSARPTPPPPLSQPPDASPLTARFVTLLTAGGSTLAEWDTARAAAGKPPWADLTPSQQERVLDVFERRAALHEVSA